MADKVAHKFHRLVDMVIETGHLHDKSIGRHIESKRAPDRLQAAAELLEGQRIGS